MEVIREIDIVFLMFLQDCVRNKYITPFFKVITSLGNYGIFWVGITIFLCILKRTRKVGVMCAFALLGTLLVNNGILKNLIGRARPYDTYHYLKALLPKQVDYSFPSGHTGSSFAAATVIYRNMPKKYGIPASILAGLIAFSRLYLGVHYPSDVLAGAISGIALGLLSEYLYQKWNMSKTQEKGFER